jgi:hypothetical protein
MLLLQYSCCIIIVFMIYLMYYVINFFSPSRSRVSTTTSKINMWVCERCERIEKWGHSSNMIESGSLHKICVCNSMPSFLSFVRYLLTQKDQHHHQTYAQHLTIKNGHLLMEKINPHIVLFFVFMINRLGKWKFYDVLCKSHFTSCVCVGRNRKRN